MKPSSSLQPVVETSAKKEEEKMKKMRSLNSSDAPVQAKKRKRIVLRVRTSTKKASGSRAPNFEALHRLKYFLENDDDMDFITHKPIHAD